MSLSRLTITHLPPALEAIKNKIDDEVESLQQSILNGSAKTIEEYKSQCAQLGAFNLVLDLINESSKV
jgi:hypothetical protein